MKKLHLIAATVLLAITTTASAKVVTTSKDDLRILCDDSSAIVAPSFAKIGSIKATDVLLSMWLNDLAHTKHRPALKLTKPWVRQILASVSDNDKRVRIFTQAGVNDGACGVVINTYLAKRKVLMEYVESVKSK